MKIINVNSADTGGQTERLSRMINREYKGIHESKGFVRGLNYINYPTDVLYTGKLKNLPMDIRKYWASADIVHMHNRWNRHTMWSKMKPDIGRIFHQHGRSVKPLEELQTFDRKKQLIRVVSTLNLLRFVRDDPNRWFPTPVDLPFLQRMKKKYYVEHEPIFIMHSPTQRHLKHTDLFLDVMVKLKEKYNVKEVLVERKTYHQTQVVRASADIIYDQLLLQHGSNGLEGMSMSIPIVAGCIGAKNTPERIRNICGKLPFVEATEETLYNVLEQLILDEGMRKEYGKIGLDYVKKWHIPPYVTDLAIKTYKEAIEMRK